MQTNDVQSRGLLQRESIKTMKKDLAHAREADAFRESQKIITTKIPFFKKEETPVAKEVPLAQEAPKEFPVESIKTPEFIPTKQPEAEAIIPRPQPKASQGPEVHIPSDSEKKRVEPTHQRTKKISHEAGHAAILTAKAHGSEEEKQKIFLLQSEKKDLEKQLQAIKGTQEISVNAEKNSIALEQKKSQEKLTALIEEEKKIEGEEKNIESQEAQTSVPADRQTLEKKRWDMESQRQKLEKKRWTMENEMVKLENNMKKLDEGFVIFTSREEEIKSKIAEIDNSLQEMSSAISQRELEDIKKSAEKKRAELEEKEQAPATKSIPLPNKEYFKNIPVAAKEKLASSIKVEEEQRRKFMEDVERWAASHPNNSEN